MAGKEGRLADNFGEIRPLEPKVIARAQRVLARLVPDTRTREELADALGITEGAIRV